MNQAEFIAQTACSRYGALQKPSELAWLIEKIDAISPRTIVEIGCDAGGTLYVWRHLAPIVLGIDLPGGPFGTGRPLLPHGATLLLGDSHDLRILGAARGFLGDRLADVVFLDGDHTFEGVMQDVTMYGPLLRDGGMLILQDIRDHHRPDVGVHRVWQVVQTELQTEEFIEDDKEDWAGIGIATWSKTEEETWGREVLT